MKTILNAREVSTIFFSNNVSYYKVLTMAKSGELPSFKAGNRYLFQINALNDWIAHQCEHTLN